MGVFDKIRRHSAIAGANFAAMFKDMDRIPPFPAAAAKLVSELNHPDADIEGIATVISADPALSSKVIQAVNSPVFAPKMPVVDIPHAITMLGTTRIRQIATVYAVKQGLPKPGSQLFDHETFWTASLLAALLTRALAKDRFKGQEDEGFTVTLLADIALPVLLSSWQEYYEPVMEEWKTSSERLSEIERRHFHWDHAQAGAWIAKSWGFPEEIVCLIGSHNLSSQQVQAAGLENTLVEPMRIASMISSVLKPCEGRSAHALTEAEHALGIAPARFADIVRTVTEDFKQTANLFGIRGSSAGKVLGDLLRAANVEATSTDSQPQAA
jgi:HD-like signal output (HDOD) protein